MLDSTKYRSKRYLHFDHRVKIEKIESYVTDPKRIAVHSFLPFIHYVTSFDKNIGCKNPEMNNRPIKTKNRDIMYAGHLDNYIYKYYAETLNDNYNEWVLVHEVDECSTAYRNNKKGKSNIDFAAEIINRISYLEEAYILVGDFTNFFDKIDHRIMKKNLLRIHQKQKLSSDWFNVYKSVTKYGYYEKDLLIKIFGTDKEIRNAKKASYFPQMKDFRNFQRKHSISKNEQKYGIPQGTAISAVFANVYSIEFDVCMKNLADQHLGMYRRYSDDFILVIPKKQISGVVSQTQIEAIEKRVRALAEENEIEIQETKTGLFYYSDNRITNLKEKKVSHIDYLGFVFDGKRVRMRGKSPYKFYRKAYKLIDSSKKVRERKNIEEFPYRKMIYSLYTDLGINRGDFGNFIAYAQRAQDTFDQLSPNTENLMMQQIKNRKKNLEKRLGIKIHTQV